MGAGAGTGAWGGMYNTSLGGLAGVLGAGG
jgi:hypothetical protein